MRSVGGVFMVVFLVALTGPPAADAASRTARVASVVDADTIRVTATKGTVGVDLLGIVAATGCGADGAATLRALLPRGAKVRLVRDGARRGAYVYRGSTLVNHELVSLGAAKAAGGRGLREGRRLRAAQRSARTLRLGVWSCDSAATAPVTGAAGGVDTPENRAELDRFFRGFRFTMTEEVSDGVVTHRLEMQISFCADGRAIMRYSMGAQSESATGTWRLHDVVRRDDQLFLGRLEVTFPDEGDEEDSDLIHGGRRADGVAVFGDDEEQSTASRAPADACRAE